MVLGREERCDWKSEQTADIRIRGNWVRNVNVYGDQCGDSKVRRRRDIIGPGSFDRYPQTAKVRYKGRMYRAKLSFRGGRGVPTYQFFVDSTLPKVET